MEISTKVRIIHEGSEVNNHGKVEYCLDQDKFYKICGYVKDLKDNFQQGELRDIEIKVNDLECTKYALEKILEWCEKTGYSNKRTQTPLSSGRLQDNLDPQSYDFIKGIEYNQGNKLKEIYEGARYFQIDPLVEVCVCRIATEFYFGNDQQSFEDLKKKLSIQEDLTIEKEEQLKQTYSWLDKKE